MVRALSCVVALLATGCGSSSFGIVLSYGGGSQFAVFPACTPLEVTYTQGGIPANVPTTQTLTVAAFNGSAFVDSACTTPLPLGTLVIPSGTSLVAFSYQPSAAGTCTVTVTDGTIRSSLSSGC
jgi:hypothetical protein